VRQGGPDAIKRTLGVARGMLEYLIDSVLDKSYASADAHERHQRVREVVELLKSEDDPSVRSMAQLYADRVAAALNFRDFRSLLDANAREIGRALRSPDDVSAERSKLEPLMRARSRVKPGQLGLDVIGAILDFPELLNSFDAFEAVALLD